jgi:hypothetical protein
MGKSADTGHVPGRAGCNCGSAEWQGAGIHVQGGYWGLFYLYNFLTLTSHFLYDSLISRSRSDLRP